MPFRDKHTFQMADASRAAETYRMGGSGRRTASRREVSRSGYSPWRRASTRSRGAITHDAARFRLYFDPAQDRRVLYNASH